ncbi:MAG: hypothetical protein GY796_16640 [Chloroflexi bacterium]|nr:hypothetical protein [Chloroflexota bacterium]
MLKTHDRIITVQDLSQEAQKAVTNAQTTELKVAITKGEQQFAQGTYKTLEEATALAEAAWQKQEQY